MWYTEGVIVLYSALCGALGNRSQVHRRPRWNWLDLFIVILSVFEMLTELIMSTLCLAMQLEVFFHRQFARSWAWPLWLFAVAAGCRQRWSPYPLATWVKATICENHTTLDPVFGLGVVWLSLAAGVLKEAPRTAAVGLQCACLGSMTRSSRVLLRSPTSH